MCEILSFATGEKVKIPRTLYELVLIRKSIQEDLNAGNICKGLSPEAHSCSFMRNHICDEYCEEDDTECAKIIRQSFLKYQENNVCWHRCRFTRLTDSNHHEISKLKSMLDDVIIREYKLAPSEWSFNKVMEITTEELDYFGQYYDHCQLSKEINRCVNPGPTTHFGYESERGEIRSMCIRTNSDRQIIIQSIRLEWELPNDKRIIYRGSNYDDDNVYCLYNESKCYSLSYGTSLFAGCMFDGGATAYHYMRKQKNAYALIISKDNPLFHLPPPGLDQLYGKGEIFHVRTKHWAGDDCREILKSEIPRDELIEQFNILKQKAIQLK